MPLVSVITATYNRSNLLPYTIGSVLRSTLKDWELWVVGDACSDDTAEVVSSFGDPRIHFYNLPQNVGEQSGPNNEGMRRASGRYFAFLNHDDLWFPDHLEKAVQKLEETGADLVFGQAAAITQSGPRADPLSRSGLYEPYLLVRASQWVFRRELHQEIGAWRSFRECWSVPSADWLQRAWRARKKMLAVPNLTVILFPSITEPGCYAGRKFERNRDYFERMTGNPGFREQLLQEIALEFARRDSAGNVLYKGARLAYHAYQLAFIRLGFIPPPLLYIFKWRRKGGVVDSFRKIRGLPPID